MPDGSPTRFWHQVRDQGLHILFGAAAGLLCAGWLEAVGAAAFYGAVREGEQWKTLNTPSVSDSALDWSFCLVGAAIGHGTRRLLWPGW